MSGNENEQSSTTLRSVGMAIAVLDCFAVDDELGVSDIARRLGVAKSTAHRMLSTTTARGITEQNPETGRYRLGLHLYELGSLAQSRHALRTVALPTLRQIAIRVSSDVHLSVPYGADVIFIERLRAREDSRMQMIGARAPAHCTSSGKAIAAFNPQADQARRAAGFPPRASMTIRTLEEWDAALTSVRATGYAYAYNELVEQSSSVAVPIFSTAHRAIGALSVYGPASSIDSRVGALVPLLRSGASAISKNLHRVP